MHEIEGIIPYTSIAQIIQTNDIPCNFPVTICNLIPLHNREEGTRKKRKVNTQERKLKSCLADTGAVQVTDEHRCRGACDRETLSGRN